MEQSDPGKNSLRLNDLAEPWGGAVAMASPQGALGNAPLGTSPCRCGGGFLRVCIPCNGFRHRVSPDLSSDKSHLVGDPSDTMRS
ncbi:hypothetical protein OUZ56_007087 [Daphnia magna]|uniref:Uncharacterized protein n=1 Tax=Daphnia magna TaxID=35525 RepID=A0ABQ9YXJ5_9CRUS|nr:hypothetical protein OUZ56_007087 [Daphnia magna]